MVHDYYLNFFWQCNEGVKVLKGDICVGTGRYIYICMRVLVIVMIIMVLVIMIIIMVLTITII